MKSFILLSWALNLSSWSNNLICKSWISLSLFFPSISNNSNFLSCSSNFFWFFKSFLFNWFRILLFSSNKSFILLFWSWRKLLFSFNFLLYFSNSFFCWFNSFCWLLYLLSILFISSSNCLFFWICFLFSSLNEFF